MTKYITLLFTLICCCSIATAQNKLSQEELDLLDKEIKQKLLYDKAKIARIDSLKQSASPSNKKDKALLFVKLGEEYETFISDSALF